jgi:hypothetical protein
MKRERGQRYLPPPGTLQELHPRHLLVIERMVHGIDRPHAAHPEITPGRPLTAAQAADTLGFRRRYVRRLLQEPVFVTALNKAVAGLRAGAVPAAINRLIELVEWQGEGRAADAKVRMDASKAVLGEDAGRLSVNVQVTNQTNVANAIRPGYVLDLGAMYGNRDDPPTIDAEPPRTDDEPE